MLWVSWCKNKSFWQRFTWTEVKQKWPFSEPTHQPSPYADVIYGWSLCILKAGALQKPNGSNCAMCIYRYSMFRQTFIKLHISQNYIKVSNKKNIYVQYMNLLKYGFCKKSLRKNATLKSWTLFSSQKGTCNTYIGTYFRTLSLKQHYSYSKDRAVKESDSRAKN